MNGSKIVIIGSGASGIACATKLIENGYDNVLILEAESRIGGRIHTIPFANNVIDLGAQWCHGEKDNIVYDIAHHLLDSTRDIYETYQCIRSNGEILPIDLAEYLKDIVCKNLVTRQQELRNYKGSLGSYLTKTYYKDLKKIDNIQISEDIAKEFFESYKKFESSVEASDDLNEVSGEGYLEYWECEGELLLNWKDKGYVEFLRLLMKAQEPNMELGILQNHILFNKQVSKISWNSEKSLLNIRCTNDEEFIADN